MQTTLLKRVDTFQELNEGTLVWMPVEDSNVLVRDPHGHIAGLGNHEIASDGTVTPSVLLSYEVGGVEQCGWHVMAKLEGWGT